MDEEVHSRAWPRFTTHRELHNYFIQAVYFLDTVITIKPSSTNLGDEAVYNETNCLGHQAPHRNRICVTEPLSSVSIAKVRELLACHPRDNAIFEVALNSGLRASDLTALLRTDLRDDGNEIALLIRERKTRKLRAITLNSDTSAVLRTYIANSTGTFVFQGQRGHKLQISTVGNLVKQWAEQIGVQGRFASHSLRKAFVRQHHDRGTPLHVLMHVLGHSSERQTATYCGLTARDVAQVYADRI